MIYLLHLHSLLLPHRLLLHPKPAPLPPSLPLLLSDLDMIIPIKCNEWTPKDWVFFHLGAKLYYDFSVTDLETEKSFLKGELGVEGMGRKGI